VNAHLATMGHHRFTLDPNVNNAPAIRSYERLGFQRVGVLRDYQLRSCRN
jgi:RimJ/RimL family protein N-acetyltransferase